MQEKASKAAKKVDVNTGTGFEKWLNKGATDNKVYFALSKDNRYVYTGITKQSTDARLYQHNHPGKNKVGKDFKKLVTQYEGLTRNQARAIEQYFIENGPNEMNDISSIAENNKYYKEAKAWAQSFLGL